MLGYELDKLDYFELFSLREEIEKNKKPKFKILILADCATQQLTIILNVLFSLNHLEVDIKEAGFDSIEMEVFDPSSELYSYKPDFIIIFMTVQRLRDRFYNSTSSKSNQLENEKEKMKQIWETLSERLDSKIVQSNFSLPVENLFGTFETKTSESFINYVRQLNHFIISESSTKDNLNVLDIEKLSGYVGRKNYLDETLWYHSKTPCALDFIPYVSQLIIDNIISHKVKSVKCVVLDLDNTLWGGVIGDDGVDGIALGHLGDGEAFVDFQHYILELKKRGIILAVCSKNEESNAKIPFLEHPEMVLKLEDIAIFVANWDNKADNIKVIKESLNIGYDSIVFLDDNPYERNLVRKFLPDVIVPELPEDPALYVRHISELNLFETSSYTDEDKTRSDMYKVEFERQKLQKKYSNLEDYLVSLEMKITLKKFDEFNLPRIAQLIQRSNQFNLTTKRYSEIECKALMEENGTFPLYCKLKDKYGDYGLISVVILKNIDSSLFIDEWIMSCRVLSRGVEQFIMNHVFDLAKELKIESVLGLYSPTSKNAMVKDFYLKFGFVEKNVSENKDVEYIISSKDYTNKIVYLNEED